MGENFNIVGGDLNTNSRFRIKKENEKTVIYVQKKGVLNGFAVFLHFPGYKSQRGLFKYLKKQEYSKINEMKSLEKAINDKTWFSFRKVSLEKNEGPFHRLAALVFPKLFSKRVYDSKIKNAIEDMRMFGKHLSLDCVPCDPCDKIIFSKDGNYYSGDRVSENSNSDFLAVDLEGQKVVFYKKTGEENWKKIENLTQKEKKQAVRRVFELLNFTMLQVGTAKIMKKI